jgi:hypothetical protein
MQEHDAQEHLLHELRNSVGAACAALEVAKRAHLRNDHSRTGEFLEYAERACATSSNLLKRTPPAVD